MSKLMLLEVPPLTASINNGVIGAFTMSILLILIGSGSAAIVVRELTIRNINSIRKYADLEKGAMYSIYSTLGLVP